MPRRTCRALPLDGLVLATSVLVSSTLYTDGLGFYSDDWQFLSVLTRSADQSPLGLAQSLLPDLLARPPQLLAIVLMYKWFGLAPLGYHVINTLTLALGVVCFQQVLREIGVGRALAFGVAAVYAALPHYSTDRFWLASFQATLGVALFFAGTYALLHAPAAGHARSISIGVGAMMLAGSALSYEVFVPLVAILTPALLLVSARHRQRQAPSSLPWQLIGVVIALAAGVVLFKLAIDTRIPEFPSLLARTRWFAAVIRDGLSLSFGEYGLGLPVVAAITLSRWPDVSRASIAGAIAVVLGAYVCALRSRAADPRTAWRGAKALTLSGPIVGVIGLAIFATNYAFMATPSGNANRTAIAAAIGVALTLVGGAAWAAERLRLGSAARVTFAGCVATLCFCGVVINATLGSFWVSAAREQTRVLALIKSVVPVLPSGSTVLLDGVCPYVGPGIVFEGPWDLAGVLQIAYGDPSLRADVITPRLDVRDDGVTTQIYGAPTFYGYSNMLAIDARAGTAVGIADAGALREFLRIADPGRGSECGGQPGAGDRIF
jgi:hypothetical protein